jgi:hypothetical protein
MTNKVILNLGSRYDNSLSTKIVDKDVALKILASLVSHPDSKYDYDLDYCYIVD